VSKRSGTSTRGATRSGRNGRSAQPRSRLQRFLLRFGWLLPVGAILIGGTILVLTYAFASIPLPREIPLTSSAEVFDRDGELIGSFSNEERRYLIDMDKLLKKRPFIGEAVIAAEDRDFYDHNGLSLKGIMRAAWANITGGTISQGGSTITQQYVKNAVLHDPSRTVTRKVREAILAIKLERRYSKDEILGFYLNTIYLGRGAYGIEAAARSYFDKHAEELTLGEAAYLAGIIPAPESYQPDENRRGARVRRDQVLEVMVEENFITQRQALRASRGRVKTDPDAPGSVLKRQPAAYFLEWLRRDYLEPEFGNDLYTGGLKIYTTLDLDMQADAEAAVGSILPNAKDPEAALVSMTPRGEVRALVGGRHFTDVRKARGFNYATDFPGRQPGSSFKPFTLTAAIDEGISPNSRFSGSSPQMITENPACDNADGTPWKVENFEGSQYGTITLDQATTNSVNAVYAQLVAEIGPDKVADTLESFGFAAKHGEDEITANCSNALGGSLDVTPLEQARAYAAFAGRGVLPDVMPIRYIEDSEGDCVKQYRPQKGIDCKDSYKLKPRRATEQNTADVATQVMTHVVQAGTATAARIDDGRPVAGKTGTTQEHKDAWFAGYVPQLTTVTWVGYPLNRKSGEVPIMEHCSDPNRCRPVEGDLGYPIEVTGGSFPARIWSAFMSEATDGMEVIAFPTPQDIPNEVINSPPPVPAGPPEPQETGSPEPEPKETPKATPTPVPTFTPEPSPTGPPTIDPSPSPGPGAGGNDQAAGGEP
jgi:penicillin-binding protein 1A